MLLRRSFVPIIATNGLRVYAVADFNNKLNKYKQ